MDTSVMPAGSVSVTVTVPVVGAVVVLVTVRVYLALVCPCQKELMCVEETLNSGVSGLITVLSLVLAVAEPPPETLTLFSWGDVAVGFTLSVTVIDG